MEHMAVNAKSRLGPCRSHETPFERWRPNLRKGLLLVTLLMCGSSSCGPAFRQYDEATNEQADSAPLVVVGLAEDDQRIGPTTPQRGNPGYPMQLHRVTVHIENVLRGEVSQRTIPVYYFAYAGGYDGPAPLIFGREPSRRILWLRKDQGRYRIACDGSNCTMPIMSGAHPQFQMSPGYPIERAVTDLLLTRGEDTVDDHEFARQIERGAPDRSDGYVIDKLRHLAITESSEVKYAACRGLWAYARSKLDNVLRERAAGSLAAAKCTCELDQRTNVVCR